MPTKGLLSLLILVGLLVYYSVAVLALRFWRKHTSRVRPTNFYADPETWVRYWQPPMLIMGLTAVGLGVGGYFALGLISPMFRWPGDLYTNIGWWSGLVLVEFVLIGCDVYMVVHARRLARRQRAAATDNDHS